MPLAFIFDDCRGVLSPLSDLRPACAIRTGAFSSIDRLQRSLNLSIIGVQVHPDLLPLARESISLPVNHVPDLAPAEPVLFINSRCPIAPPQTASLHSGECLTEAASGDMVAALGRAEDIRLLLAGGTPAWLQRASTPAPALLSRPWHVKTFRDRCLAIDLEFFRDSPTQSDLPGVHVITGPSRSTIPSATRPRPVILPTATVYPTATFDVEHGPVVIDEHATIRPHALIIGPAYIGPHSTVLDKAIIKPGTAIGPHCKVAGEIGGTIFQGFANKAHDGHLGDSFIGEWANLGAGTTNSNLLNTYGEVVARATPGGSNERTGEQFLGCIVGDHVKFAIGSRIMTGAVIHTGTMWAAGAAATGCVSPFSWVTDAGSKSFRFDKFMEIARTAMARRKVTPTTSYEKRLRSLAAAPPR